MPAQRTTQRPATRTSAASRSAAPRTSTRPRTRPGTAARPALTPREAEALRALLAARQQAATAGGPGVRRPATRPRPATRTATRRAPARSPRTRPERTGAPWRTRVGVIAAGVLVVPVAAALLLPGPTTPGSDDAPRSADQLAMAAHTGLIRQGDRYAEVEQELTRRQIELAKARKAEAAARTVAESARAAVGTGAADLFRTSPADRLPVLGLDLHDPAGAAGVLYRQALTERADAGIEQVVVRAQRAGSALEAASRTVSDAQARVASAAARAEELLAETRARVDDLAPGVAATIAGLSRVPSSGAQRARDERAVARWQAYLRTLGDAGIEPPPAADLADPERLPAGLSPALHDGTVVPGVAWAVVGSSPVTVLPAETVGAVSSALSQLGKPFVPGTAGPDTYDCGGFTAASWVRAGWAIPETPAAQWRRGTAVPVSSLQIGDLVLSPGGLDVGMYLGGGDVLAASASGYRVTVRSVPAGASAVRVTLGAAEEPNPALPASPGALACGARPAEHSAGTTPDPAWGGWSNGQIPGEALCELGVRGHALRCDAAEGYARMAQAYADRFGRQLCITDSYRSFGAQLTAFAVKPALAAVPGTSNHGWALAVDLCGGVNGFGTPQWRWMAENAGRFGWVQPTWAGPGGEKPEPWHWEFGIIS